MKKGEKVRVRLSTCEVVEAVYIHAGELNKVHWVKRNGELLMVCDSPHGGTAYRRCRFVGPPCVLVPVGVSV